MEKALNEKARKIAAILALSNNYGKVMEDNLLGIWLDLLNDFSATEVERGVKEVIETYEYKTRPPFAVLRKAIEKVTGKNRIDPEEQLVLEAQSEWDRVLDAIRRLGSYRHPDYLDNTTKFVLRGFGGWDAVCKWETDRLDWKRKEFIDRWKIARGREWYMLRGANGIRELAEHLSEISDCNNNLPGIEQ